MPRRLTPPPLADRTVVFPVELAAAVARAGCGRPAPNPSQDVWQPDLQTITRLEAQLEAPFGRIVATTRFHLPDQHALEDYYRQYAGIVVSGHRLVCINAFHAQFLDMLNLPNPQDPYDWQHRVVDVADGGTLFWSASFDTESGTITGMAFGGGGVVGDR